MFTSEIGPSSVAMIVVQMWDTHRSEYLVWHSLLRRKDASTTLLQIILKSLIPDHWSISRVSAAVQVVSSSKTLRALQCFMKIWEEENGCCLHRCYASQIGDLYHQIVSLPCSSFFSFSSIVVQGLSYHNSTSFFLSVHTPQTLNRKSTTGLLRILLLSENNSFLLLLRFHYPLFPLHSYFPRILCCCYHHFVTAELEKVVI